MEQWIENVRELAEYPQRWMGKWVVIKCTCAIKTSERNRLLRNGEPVLVTLYSYGTCVSEAIANVHVINAKLEPQQVTDMEAFRKRSAYEVVKVETFIN